MQGKSLGRTVSGLAPERLVERRSVCDICQRDETPEDIGHLGPFSAESVATVVSRVLCKLLKDMGDCSLPTAHTSKTVQSSTP
jgi:hypothetical protein